MDGARQATQYVCPSSPKHITKLLKEYESPCDPFSLVLRNVIRNRYLTFETLYGWIRFRISPHNSECEGRKLRRGFNHRVLFPCA